MTGYAVAYRCMWILLNYSLKSEHFIEEGEANIINWFRDAGFSMPQIAYIVNRSTASIHKHVHA